MAKTLILAVATLALVGVALADCPGACSGHGTCQSWRDFCECYDGWQGNDCAQRTCAYGLSWIDTPNGDLDTDNALNSGFGNQIANAANRPAGVAQYTALNPQYRPNGWWERHPSQLFGVNADNHANLPLWVRTEEGHFYAECSNRGICDRSIGECACFTGYGGAACNRTVCANDCSGHGVCKSVRQVTPATSTYNLYDVDKSYGCVCDPEYFGNDCSLRRCYRNDDPLTPVTTRRGFSEKLSEQNEVQILRVGCAYGGAVKTGSTLKLTYTDVQFGEKYTTPAFDPSDAGAAATLLGYLRGLPNDVLASSPDYDKVVSVTRDSIVNSITSAVSYRFSITFHHSLGNVPTLLITDGVQCTAGFEYPANYKTDGWKELISAAIIGNGPAEDTLVTFKVIADSNSGTADTYAYKVETTGATAGAFSTARDFPAADTWVTVDGTATTNVNSLPSTGVSPLTNALKAAFKFSLPADDGTNGGALRPANALYKIQFRAPATAVSIGTQLHNISSTLPIAYKLYDTLNAKYMQAEYSTQFNTPAAGTDVIAITMTSATAFTWTINGAGGNTGVSINAATASKATYTDGWVTLTDNDAATSLAYERVRFKFPDTTYGGAEVFSVNINPGAVTSGGAAAVEVLTVAWVNVNSLPIDRVEITVRVSNVAATPDRYQWSLNGVNMGEYDFAAGANALGGSANTEAAKITVSFAGAAHSGTRAVGQSWYFSLVRTPIQSAWAYQEVLRVEYIDSVTLPSKNLGIAMRLVSTDTNPDTFKWKLVTDEDYQSGAWDIQQDPSGNWVSLGNFPALPALLTDYAQHPFEAAEMAKYLFSFSGGVDYNKRSCVDNSVNSNYYVQLGQEGINDFVTCSDRGVCDESTGQCKCFKGYYGEDCHEQHALYM